VTSFDHRDDVFFPAEEVSLGGDWVEVVAGRRRNPREVLGWLFALQSVASERAQRGPVVLVRVFVFVLAVDPADQRVCCGSILGYQSKITFLFEKRFDVFDSTYTGLIGFVVLLEISDRRSLGNDRHPADVPKEFQLAMIADFRLHEPHVVTHFEKMPTIRIERDLAWFIAAPFETFGDRRRGHVG
jgi:hypothetical protein